MRTYSEMMQLHNDGKLAVLTEDVAKTLIGKKISTLYFGYADQDDVDTFTFGSLDEKQRIITTDGRNTHIYLWDGVFCCTDNDRWVSYIVEE